MGSSVGKSIECSELSPLQNRDMLQAGISQTVARIVKFDKEGCPNLVDIGTAILVEQVGRWYEEESDVPSWRCCMLISRGGKKTIKSMTSKSLQEIPAHLVQTYRDVQRQTEVEVEVTLAIL